MTLASKFLRKRCGTVRSQLIKRCGFLIFLGALLSAVAWPASNSSFYTMKAVVRLLSHQRKFICSGAIVGIHPLKVLTAAHCVGNLSDGDAEMIDPTLDEIPPDWNAPMLRSQKVFLSENENFLKKLEAAVEARSKLFQANEQQKKSARAKMLGQVERKKLLLSLREAPLAARADLHEKLLKLDETEEGVDSALQESSDEASVYGKQVDDAFNEIFNVEDELASLDLAVLVFAEKTQNPVKDLPDMIQRMKVLPLASAAAHENAQVMIGGFGLMGEDQPNRTNLPRFTINSLASLEGAVGLYTSKGILRKEYENENIKLGEMGSPLRGDSGGPALSERGLLGVVSVLNEGKLIEPVPPKEGWPNDRVKNRSYWNEYEAANAAYVSTTSVAARAIFKRVEAEFGPLVYDSDKLNYAAIFQDHLKDFYEQTKPREVLKIGNFRLGDTVLTIPSLDR